MQRNSCCSKAALQTCLLPESYTPLLKNVGEAVTSVMLNRFVPKEISRNHSLLPSTQGAHFFLLFPCVLWDRTTIFSERGLCTLAFLPAPLNRKEKQNRKAWSAQGCPTLSMEIYIHLEIALKGVLEKGKKRAKKRKGKEQKKEGRKKKGGKSQVRAEFMWKSLLSIPDWDF